jgi:hypothetical protein
MSTIVTDGRGGVHRVAAHDFICGDMCITNLHGDGVTLHLTFVVSMLLLPNLKSIPSSAMH